MASFVEDDRARLVADTGFRYQYLDDNGIVRVAEEYGGDEVFYNANGELQEPGERLKVISGQVEAPPAAESLKDMMECFFKASGELAMELGISCREIGRRRFGGLEDSPLLKNLRRGCVYAAARLDFLNEYLPEDRDPKHAWPVIIFVFLLAIIGILHIFPPIPISFLALDGAVTVRRVLRAQIFFPFLPNIARSL